MGKAHSNAWRNVGAFHPEVPAVARRVLVGRDPDGVAAAARQYGWAESATDWRDVLERDDIDIVDVCTPGHLHHEIAIAALAAGKHVLVEKPLTNTMAQSTELVEAAVRARSAGVQSMVGFNYRCIPALALARALIADGRIGAVREVRAAYLQDWLVDASAPMSWRLRKERGGLGRARRPRLARRRPAAVPARRRGRVGDRAPGHVRADPARAGRVPSR